MELFLDTANIDEIRRAAAMGVISGVTTNPSLIAKSGRKFIEVIEEICSIVPGPVSAEVAATDYDGMMREAHVLRAIARSCLLRFWRLFPLNRVTV